MRKSILLVLWSGVPVLAQTAAAPTRPSTIPDTDGVYAVTRLVNHAEAGLLPLTAAEGVDVPTWAEVGPRVKVLSSAGAAPVVMSQTSANDRYGVSYTFAKAGTCPGATLLRVNGRWRLEGTDGSDWLSCSAAGEIQDTPPGFAARVAAVLGTTPIGWVATGDRVIGSFAPTKPVYQRGEPITIVFTMRNPADAPPVRGGAGWWSFELTRDGHLVAGMGADFRVIMPPRPAVRPPAVRPSPSSTAGVLGPGDSASQARLLTGWRDVDLSVPGHYEVRVWVEATFTPSGGPSSEPSNPGGTRDFSGVAAFEVGRTTVAGVVDVRGHVTGPRNLVAAVTEIQLEPVPPAGGVAAIQADGAFDFPLVPAGTYQIGTFNPIAPLRPLVVGDRNPTEVTVPIAAREVSGHVTAGPRQRAPSFTLVLRGTGFPPGAPIAIPIAPGRGGTFRAAVPLGRWVVDFGQGLPAGVRVTSLTYGATDLLRDTLVVTSDSVELNVTLGRLTPAPMSFVSIRPGEFMMGCSVGDSACLHLQKPAHLVRITKGFDIGTYPVTQAQWESVMSTMPSGFPGATRPVEGVSWDAVQEFLRRLNALHDGYRYRLPTEAEWEYAARAGTTGPFIGPIEATTWYSENSGGETHPVGQQAPKAWGLYDMEGNVAELVQDFYKAHVEGFGNIVADESDGLQIDPVGPRGLPIAAAGPGFWSVVGPPSGPFHVVRGGLFDNGTVECRASRRYADVGQGGIGFRVVRVPTP